MFQRAIRSADHHAFTLVELLVVIGIIAVLIAILLPSLSKAREAANTVACSSNMRQIGTAAFMYANEFGAYPPAGYVSSTPTGNRILTWDRLLSGYLGGHVTLDYDPANADPTLPMKKFREKSLAVYTCPSDAYIDRFQGSVQYDISWRQSYSAARPWRSSNGFMGVQQVAGDANSYAFPTLGVMDWGDLSTHGSRSSNSKGLQNVQYMKFIRPGQGKNVCIMIVERPMANNIQGDDACASTIDPTWQLTVGGGNPVYTPNHAGSTKMNYLFSDGHVDLLTREETIVPGTSLQVLVAGSMWCR